MSHIDEAQRLEEVAIQLFHDDKILQAARVLLQAYQGDGNVEVLKSDKHNAILEQAEACERLVACFQDEKPTDWVGGKGVAGTGAHHGDTAIYYKIVDNDSSAEKRSVNRLQCRLHTPISESLLVPIISVLNESQLYHTWIPSWSFPVKFGVRRVEKIKQVGRCSQIIIVTCDLPWPLSPREIVLRAIASDDIDAFGRIVIKLDGLQDGDPDVPPLDDIRTVRLHLNGGFLIENYHQEGGNHPIMLKFYCDVHSKAFIPLWFLDFAIKTILLTFWERLLKIAIGIRNGTRKLHVEAIQEKKILYDWVTERANTMLSSPSCNG